MGKSPQGWLRVSIINLLIVSFVGVILRYKIAFSLPFIDQKHLLHAHSHFAFAGWINQAIMALIIHAISSNTDSVAFKKYRPLLYINLITAYGMLISFAIAGYSLFSIGFSTISIINSYIFGIMVWKDLNKANQQLYSYSWYKAGILFNMLSSFGAFTLSYLMANSSVNQNYYLLAVYTFLHFQYNGWFFFICMGLFISQIEKIKAIQGSLQIAFWLLGIACIPAYFLSALWLPIPPVGFIIIVLAAFAQFAGWLLIVKNIYKNKEQFKILFNSKGRWLLYLAAIALSIKLFLQLISTIPMLSRWAFGFRPIVIGFLHLMLLGVLSLFIIGYLYAKELFKQNFYTKMGSMVLVTGIIGNQLLLLVQGIEAMHYVGIPYLNESLFIAAIVMFIGLVLLNIQSDWSHKTKN